MFQAHAQPTWEAQLSEAEKISLPKFNARRIRLKTCYGYHERLSESVWETFTTNCETRKQPNQADCSGIAELKKKKKKKHVVEKQITANQNHTF